MRAKFIYQKDLTPDCWRVQVWGLPYCSGFGDYKDMCYFLATNECEGQSIRKKILTGQFPKDGLSEADPASREPWDLYEIEKEESIRAGKELRGRKPRHRGVRKPQGSER